MEVRETPSARSRPTCRGPLDAPRSILLIHPDDRRAAVLAETFRRDLGPETRVRRVRSLRGFGPLPRSFDVVVLGLGRGSTPDMIARVALASRGLPLLVVDGELDVEGLRHAAGLGVQQHLSARCASCGNQPALASTLRWAMARHERGEELARTAERARFDSLHDPLTRLANRRLYEDRLTLAFAEARRSGRGFALLLLDLDDFKSVNDEFGHAVGDKLLRLVAERLQRVLRATDLLARVGGDEFMVILGGAVTRTDARISAARLEAALREPFEVHGRRIRVQASIGAVVHPADGRDAAALERAADRAMYAAKRARARVLHRG
jgi:diguanylate cyclase (GGDEF)-like protein